MKTKRILSFILSVLIITGLLSANISAESTSPFNDIQNHKYRFSIEWAYETGLMNGVSENRFSPDSTLNRAMVVTVLHRLSGDSGNYPTTGFIDVKNGDYFENAVNWAYNKKIVTGTSESTFSPSNKITKQDFSVMLYRFANLQGRDTTLPPGYGYEVRDIMEVSNYAKTAVLWCMQENLIDYSAAPFECVETVMPDGTVINAIMEPGFLAKPKTQVTRGETASYLKRFDGSTSPYFTTPLDPSKIIQIELRSGNGPVSTITEQNEINRFTDQLNSFSYVEKVQREPYAGYYYYFSIMYAGDKDFTETYFLHENGIENDFVYASSSEKNYFSEEWISSFMN